MGVKGLWRLLLPIGRRISIETLEGQVLAIDASIWLIQFVKAMRTNDDENNDLMASSSASSRMVAAAHLIGFFHRICRLRYHGIRPIFVFDANVMPEIKRHELERRRRRREQFSSLNDSAIQKLAKKILTDKLKSIKTNNNAAKNKHEAKDNKDASNKTTAASASSFAPGFNPSEQDTHPVQRKENDDNDLKLPASVQEVIDVDEESGDGDDHHENDWDDEVAYNEPDSPQQGSSSTHKDSYYDDINIGDDMDFNLEYIATLPPNKRKDAIEMAKRRQRMKSRKEFMPAAANPLVFSQVQIANFLKSSKLNTSIAQMATKAAQRDNRINGGLLMDSDRTTRVELLREEQESSSEEEDHNDAFAPRGQRPTAAAQREQRVRMNMKHRLSNKRREVTTLDESSSSEDEHSGSLSIRHQKHGASKTTQRVIFDVDDSESENENPTSIKDHDVLEANKLTRKLPVLQEDSDEESADSEEGAGGFLRPSKTAVSAAFKEQVKDFRKKVEEVLQASEEIERDPAVGFIKTAPSTMSDATGPQKMPGAKEDNYSQPVNAVSPQNRDSMQAQELADRALAEALQQAEDVDAAMELGGDVVEEQIGLLPQRAVDGQIQCHDDRTEDSLDSCGEEDDDIDWQDGVSPELKQPREMQTSLQHDSVVASDNVDEDSAVHESSFWEDGYAKSRNDIKQDGPTQTDTMLSHETTAALERAQATASNLANWAGIVFRRAMKEAASPTTDKSAPKSIDHSRNDPGTSIDEGSSVVDTISNPGPSKELSRDQDQTLGDDAPVTGKYPLFQKEKNGEVESEPWKQGAATKTRDIGESIEIVDFSLDDEETNRDWAEERSRRERDMDNVSDEMREEAIQLLQLFGVPFIEAPAEAEAQCAALEQLGIVNGVVTEDSDVFVFGGSTVYKNIFDEKKYAEVYKACDAEREMSLGRDEFVALAYVNRLRVSCT